MMDNQGLYGIYGVWHTPFWQKPVFISVGKFLIFLLINISFYFLCRWIKKRGYKAKPYWKLAAEKIESVGVDYKAGSIAEDQVYVALTGAMKDFLSSHYGLQLKGKTDDETVCLLEELALADEKKESLGQLFKNGVLIKFSPMHVAQEQVQADLRMCSLFVQESISDATKQ